MTISEGYDFGELCPSHAQTTPKLRPPFQPTTPNFLTPPMFGWG